MKAVFSLLVIFMVYENNTAGGRLCCLPQIPGRSRSIHKLLVSSHNTHQNVAVSASLLKARGEYLYTSGVIFSPYSLIGASSIP